jgi:hypothetical protein
VNHPGVEQDTLSERCLAGIDMSSDTDIPGPLERKSTIRRIGIGSDDRVGGHMASIK